MRHCVQLLLPLAQIARGPVELPQAVQDGALYAVLGIALENYFLVGIVFDCGIEQAQHARMHQIVQIHVYRQALMNPDRDGLHQRKILQARPGPAPRYGCCFLPACRSIRASPFCLAPFDFTGSLPAMGEMQRDNQTQYRRKALVSIVVLAWKKIRRSDSERGFQCGTPKRKQATGQLPAGFISDQGFKRQPAQKNADRRAHLDQLCRSRKNRRCPA